MKRNIKFLLVLSFVAVNLTAASQTVADSVARVTNVDGMTLSVTLTPDSITIGDQATLTLTVNNVGNHTVVFPPLQQMNYGSLEPLSLTMDTILSADGKKQIVQKVIMTSFNVGRNPVAGFSVIVADAGNGSVLFCPDTLLLDVAYMSDADTVSCEVKADSGIVSEPYTFWEIFRWILWGLLAVAAIFAVVWIIKRRKENKPIVVLPHAKPVSPDRRALSELEALRRKELWQKGRVKKYYTDMTDIVRRFLHNMYGISASEMTTRQTLRAFHAIDDWSEESDTLLKQLLQKADMVKFAKSQPATYEHDLAMQNAVDFIRKVVEVHKLNNPENEEKK